MIVINIFIGFSIGCAVMGLAFGLYGNPRADQLERDSAFLKGKVEMLEFDVTDLKLRNSSLQDHLSSCLEALIAWERWSGNAMREMPGVVNHTEDEESTE
ncbi:hypothetical protein UFOVP1229_143 [uncultured Caudovirales phage]|uniref:Uncharacterized protein n=1 Tax=uncultured Caudovirales phage TaxID=2100421 RepID=A0A6J5RJ40_9CAUD|nr:hypothetical protein UFOVP1229_143 [uncultured Caudovirales phage]